MLWTGSNSQGVETVGGEQGGNGQRGKGATFNTWNPS